MALKSSSYIRRADRDDLDRIVSWREDPAFMRFLYGDRTASPKQIREQIVAMLGRSPGNTTPTGVHFVVDSDKKGPIGLISVVNIGWRNRSCNVDTYISADVRNSFVGAMSWFRVIDFCFRELNMHRVNLYVYTFNPRSWRVIERSGAKRELTLNHHVFRDGEFHGMYGYGMITPEWENFLAEFQRHFKGIDLLSMIQERKRVAAEQVQ